MKTYIEVSVYKQVEIDDYENGCLLEGEQDFGVIDTFKVNHIDDALAMIKTYGEVYIYDDKLEIQKMENGDGNEPMDYQLVEWKKGNRKLYLANYSFYLKKVTSKPLDNDDLTKAFPLLENNT